MRPEVSQRLRLLASAVSVLVVVVTVAGGWFYFRMRASLPLLDGSSVVSSLSASVTIDRDAQGVPTVRGSIRLDVTRALGWLHAQDRFFQMDLLRRSAAGELAELFGEAALPLDRSHRLHGFRALASKVLARLAPAERAQLEAYTAGVNAGLAALREKPFEYLVLRTTPRAWHAEDCVLVGYAMMLDLQGDAEIYERSLMVVRDKLGLDALAFFAPLIAPGDAALDGSTGQLSPIPSSKVLDLRGERTTATPQTPPRVDAMQPGSNSLALAGAHTANGVALLASDMHLNLTVPNTWYRASLEWPSSAKASEGTARRKITGVTLPGTPAMVAGSNGQVAWGFTNANVDICDLVVVEVDSISAALYHAPGYTLSLEIEKRHETIHVKGGASVAVDYEWTIWGPIVGRNAENRPLALRWTAHDPDALNFALFDLENATDVRAAVSVAHRAGIPTQSFLVADAAGDIAWTIAGRVPRRVGYDGRLPVTWAYGDRRWDGALAPEEIPVEFAAASGRLSTANQRLVGGAALARLGDGGYDRGARGAQIRDALAKLERATPRDLLAIELDDRALFHERWQKLLLAVLTPEVTAQKSSRAKVRSLVEKWEGRASVDSVSYRLVRAFRRAVARRALTPIFERCVEFYPAFDWSKFRYEDALWALIHEKPAHLLNPASVSWEALLVGAADDLEKISEDVPLEKATWGRFNLLQVQHPFSFSLPGFLANRLNMPREPMPGDRDMPRVQTPSHGASERFAVSPGREAEGIFHMPGGQSGHPLSPYYRAGHSAWVRGEPTPFLPGETKHTLLLQP